jgi:hypothetical protein
VVAVAIAVNRHLVAAGDDLFEPARISLHLLPYDEERGPRSRPFELPEERIQPTVGPVVEG